MPTGDIDKDAVEDDVGGCGKVVMAVQDTVGSSDKVVAVETAVGGHDKVVAVQDAVGSLDKVVAVKDCHEEWEMEDTTLILEQMQWP